MKTKISLICKLFFAFLVFSCKNSDKNNISNPKKQSLWSDTTKNNFVSKYSKTEFDKFVLSELIAENEFNKAEPELLKTIQSPDFKNYINTRINDFVIVVDDLAGKSKSDVEKILGQPNNKEKVNPSKTPCPCDKYLYLDNLVEIVFMNSKADWITINNTSSYVKINNSSNYQSVSTFDDYIYVKVSTK